MSPPGFPLSSILSRLGWYEDWDFLRQLLLGRCTYFQYMRSPSESVLRLRAVVTTSVLQSPCLKNRRNSAPEAHVDRLGRLCGNLLLLTARRFYIGILQQDHPGEVSDHYVTDRFQQDFPQICQPLLYRMLFTAPGGEAAARFGAKGINSRCVLAERLPWRFPALPARSPRTASPNCSIQHLQRICEAAAASTAQ